MKTEYELLTEKRKELLKHLAEYSDLITAYLRDDKFSSSYQATLTNQRENIQNLEADLIKN